MLFKSIWGGGGSTSGSAQDLFLALHPGLVPGSVQGPFGMPGIKSGWLGAKQTPSPLTYARDPTPILTYCFFRGKKPNPCGWGGGSSFLLRLQEVLQSAVLENTPSPARWGARPPAGPAPARMPHATSAVKPALPAPQKEPNLVTITRLSHSRESSRPFA